MKKFSLVAIVALTLAVSILAQARPVQAAITPVFDVSGGYFDDSFAEGAYIEWSVYIYGTQMYSPYTVSMDSNCNGSGLGETKFLKWKINSLPNRQYSQTISIMIPWNKLKDPVATIPVKITGMKKSATGTLVPVVLYRGTVAGPTCR